MQFPSFRAKAGRMGKSSTTFSSWWCAVWRSCVTELYLAASLNGHHWGEWPDLESCLNSELLEEAQFREDPESTAPKWLFGSWILVETVSSWTISVTSLGQVGVKLQQVKCLASKEGCVPLIALYGIRKLSRTTATLSYPKYLFYWRDNFHFFNDVFSSWKHLRTWGSSWARSSEN